MIYYIELRKNAEHTAGPKAPNDIYDISKNLGYKSLKLQVEYEKDSKLMRKFKVNKMWISLFSKLKKGDVVIFQHPTYGIKEAIRFIPLLKKTKQIKFISVIHDLELLRGGVSTYDNKIAVLSDKVLLPMFDKIICHNESMKKYLINEGICESKLVTLDIFDYLTNTSELSENKGIGLTIAGNLNKDKSGYLYKLIEEHPNYTLNLYVPNFDGNKDWYTYVFTAKDYTGNLTKDCNEGDLVWVKKNEIQNIKTWEGDYIFLDWLVQDKPFFSAKFNYKDNKFIDYEVTFYD